MRMRYLLMIYEIPIIEIVNQDLIASEIVRALAGSIGLVFTVPFTALAVGLINKKGKMNNKHSLGKIRPAYL